MSPNIQVLHQMQEMADVLGLFTLQEYLPHDYRRYQLQRSLSGVLNSLQVPCVTMESGRRRHVLWEDVLIALSALGDCCLTLGWWTMMIWFNWVGINRSCRFWEGSGDETMDPSPGKKDWLFRLHHWDRLVERRRCHRQDCQCPRHHARDGVRKTNLCCSRLSGQSLDCSMVVNLHHRSVGNLANRDFTSRSSLALR